MTTLAPTIPNSEQHGSPRVRRPSLPIAPVGMVVFAVLLLSRTPIAAGEVRVGTARVDITPPAGFVMGGYSARQGVSQGVHDPLFATAVVMKTAGTTLAVVSLDLRSFPSSHVVETLRELYGIEHTLLCSTHTHSGPLTWEDKAWPQPDQSWFRSTEQKIIAVVREAAGSLFEAEIRVGTGEVYLGHNRRMPGDNGRTVMLWRNEEQRPTSPVDPKVRVVQILDTSGRTRAVLVNYACHAVVLGPDNRAISADWPGFMRARVEEQMDGALCLFIQGAAGDTNPFLDKQPLTEGGFEEAGKTGQEMAAEVLRLLEEKRTSRVGGDLKIRQDLLEASHRWIPEKTIQIGVSTLLVGRELAIACWPGEAFVDFQLGLADLSPTAQTFFFGYCFSAGEKWAGYFPTIQAAVEGGYGASYNTTVAVGTGENLLRLNLRRLHEMLGELEVQPSDLPGQ